MPGHPSQIAERAQLRTDAEHNRERILDAAREAFSTRGLDVPMAAIARRAGVGVATLYRRFPSRESLITEVFSDQLASCATAVEEALADPDPWHAFQSAVEKVCAMQVADHGFTGAFLTAFPQAVDFERARRRAEQGFDEIIRRAKAAGRLRADFVFADFLLLLQANCAVTDGAGDRAQAASRRLVAYLLQAFRAENAAPLPPAPPLALDHVIPSLS